MTKKTLYKAENVYLDGYTLVDGIAKLTEVLSRAGEEARINIDFDSYTVGVTYKRLETDKEYETRTGREKTLQEKEMEIRRQQYEKLKKEFE